MKKIFAGILAAVLTVTTLTACDGHNKVEENPPYPVTVDGVTVEQKPKAVASLSPVLTELLLDLGYQRRITGYSDEDTIPDPLPEEPPVSSESTFRWPWEEPEPVEPPAETLPTGQIGTALVPNMEMIGELKPEIIFTTVAMTRAQMDKLSAVNIKVVVMPAVTSLEELKTRYLDIIRIMDGALAAQSSGEAAVSRLQSRLDDITAKVPEKKSFLYVNSLEPLVATGDTFESAVLSCVGENLAAAGTGYSLSAEELAALDPDIIFYDSSIGEENLKENAAFKEKSAVANGSLVPIDRTILLSEKQDLPDRVRDIAAQLYPDTDFTETVSSDTETSGEE